jgi:hypothetical protein
MPTMRGRVEVTPKGSGAQMVMTASFESADAMKKLLEMGADEGIKQAIGQIDAIVANAC